MALKITDLKMTLAVSEKLFSLPILRPVMSIKTVKGLTSWTDTVIRWFYPHIRWKN